MDVSAESVRVFIGGDEYFIKSDVDAETTRQIANYVDQKMTEYQKRVASRDKLKIAVLSALNIAGELFEQRTKCDEANRQLARLRERAEELTTRLETLL
jgi:cell division protein ZapA